MNQIQLPKKLPLDYDMEQIEHLTNTVNQLIDYLVYQSYLMQLGQPIKTNSED